MGCFGDMEWRQERCAVAAGDMLLFCFMERLWIKSDLARRTNSILKRKQTPHPPYFSSYSRHMHPIWLKLIWLLILMIQMWWAQYRPGFSPMRDRHVSRRRRRCCCCWPEVNTVCALHSGGQRTQKVIAVCQRHHSASLPLFWWSATVYLSLLNDNRVASYLFFLQHWHNAPPPRHCAMLHCDGKHSGDDLKAHTRQTAAVTDKNKPNKRKIQYEIQLVGGKVHVKCWVSSEQAMSNESITT